MASPRASVQAALGWLHLHWRSPTHSGPLGSLLPLLPPRAFASLGLLHHPQWFPDPPFLSTFLPLPQIPATIPLEPRHQPFICVRFCVF